MAPKRALLANVSYGTSVVALAAGVVVFSLIPAEPVAVALPLVASDSVGVAIAGRF